MTMKTLITLLALFIFSGANAWQDDALVRFQLNYSDDYRLSVRDINTSIDDAMAEGEGKDRVVDTFIGEMYRIFNEEYAPKFGLDPMDLGTYPEKLVFDPYGFPQAGAKRAAKFMTARRYYAVEILLDRVNGLASSDRGGLTIKEVGLKGDKKKFKPRIEVRLMIYDVRGKKKNAVKAAGKSKEKITIQEKALFGIIPVGESQKLEESQRVILDTFRMALDKVVEKY